MQTKPDRNAWLTGGDARCDRLPNNVAHPHRFVLLGAPGIGKGTQAELLCEHLGTCHLSTGDVLRTAKNSCHDHPTPIMAIALNSMKRGELVSDETMLALVRERSWCLHCGGGFLLDGFPRTVAQASALDKMLAEQNLELEAALNYELPLEKIVARLSGRRTCASCQAVFHIETRPPQFAGVCDHCGGDLIQREDDHPASVRARMNAYLESTVPLTKFYNRRGLLISISAEGTPEEIFDRTLVALKINQDSRAPTLT